MASPFATPAELDMGDCADAQVLRAYGRSYVGEELGPFPPRSTKTAMVDNAKSNTVFANQS